MNTLIIPKANPTKPTSTLEKFGGKTACITGKVWGETRQSAELKLQRLGMSTLSNVTKNVDFLILGNNGIDPNQSYPSIKIKRAKQYGIPIIYWAKDILPLLQSPTKKAPLIYIATTSKV